ncbi:adenylate/guanylate cyclase domain-containing protein [Salinispirillum sp. LH 10-3-1]|uniref:Adenylate/guanylate cyclase domain-containing protein n=1 Tax=Salinispirillum sp. LH 10-3-1 TaxID=2952525 RepID=A0AB38YD73_9GAMM
MSSWRTGVGLAVTVLLVSTVWLLIAWRPPAMVAALSNAVSDNFYQWQRRDPPGNVVFVEVDNASVRALGRWPWPRDVIAEGLAQLHLATAVGVDILFSEPTTAAHDHILAETLAQLPSVGGAFLNGPLATEMSTEEYDILLDSSLLQSAGARLLSSELIELPVSPIMESYTLLATLNTREDSDQLIRRYPLAFHVSDLVVPNLGVQMWRLGALEDLQLSASTALLGDRALPIDARGTVRLNYYAPERYQRLNFLDLLSPDWEPERLRGHYVIVGVSEAGVSDLRATPVGQFPGPLMHLTLVANVLDDNLLFDVTGGWLLLVLLMALACWAGVMCLSAMRYRLVSYGLLLVGTYGAGILLYTEFNIWLAVFYPLVLLLVMAVVGELWRFLQQRAETAALRQAFGNYVAPALVEEIIGKRATLQLGGKHQPLTLLFTDLRNFTPLTERLATEDLVAHLNAYFGVMIAELQRYRGTLDKLMGDAVMGLFNAPLEDPEHAYHACLAAAAMQHALVHFNRQFPPDDLHRLTMGIGISTGDGVVGNIGGPRRFNYTAIGDVVNTAARLESATKDAQTEHGQPVDILLCAATYAEVKERLPCHFVGELALKGKANPMPCWALGWRQLSVAWLREQAVNR